jgi:23S rRNA (guanosine2251-2'-O)-methyltransferase
MPPSTSFISKKKNTHSPHGVVFYGKHAVFAALQNPERTCQKLLLLKSFHSAHVPQFNILMEKKKIHFVSHEELDKLLPISTPHQGIIGYFSPKSFLNLEDYLNNLPFENQSRLLILDQLTDPQNVGAIIRSAAAFDFNTILITKNHSPSETGALAKAASGCLELIQIIQVTNLSQAINTLKDNQFWVIALDGSGTTPLSNIPYCQHLAVIIGAEGQGIRRLTREHADWTVSIPISKNVESLNASNATAITLYTISQIIQ